MMNGDLRAAVGRFTAPPGVKARATARAIEEGLADVGYDRIDSPVGPIVLAATARGLVRLSYHEPDAVLTELAAKVSPRVLEAPALVEPARAELEEYFEGRRQGFDLPIDWTLAAGFTRRVLDATAAVPFGETISYRDAATRAGSPDATRAAGNALGANPLPIVVPCHRVIRSSGAMGHYTGGDQIKAFLLRLEGAAAAR